MLKHYGLLGVLFVALTGIVAGCAWLDDFLNSQPPSPSSPGLVAWWRFEESGGDAVIDSSGNGNHGVLYGATRVAGRQGKALKFDGIDDYVEVPNTGGAFDLVASWTVEVWAKPLTSAPADRIGPIVWKIANNGGNEDTFVLAWSSEPGTSQEGSTFWTKLERAMDDEDLPVLSRPHIPNQWYHVAAIYDGSNIMIYVNGVLEGSRNIGSVMAYTGPAPLRMGNVFNSDHCCLGVFDGLIDEVRIYNRPLNPSEFNLFGSSAVPSSYP